MRVHPPVWRRVHVPSTASLQQLHEIIQVAMGWEQHHLHLFGKEDLEYMSTSSRGAARIEPL
ncbi:IS1096 element passenger TnpR family protein [Nonomuraea recticatena]|uniref:Plasmid pRiA4b Orf3-like domain-containing protein n=1 Tax=Nonomuraea recticatena TaxID=46178 RepID=A0ABN3TCB7_9ACTN